MTGTYSIMFVCTGNTCRSPMAEGGLRKLLENRGINDVTVFSSGTGAATGFPPTEYAAEAARIWNADITSQRSHPLTPELIGRADLILTMSSVHCREVIRLQPEARPKTFMLKNYPESGCDGEDVDDPIGASLDIYNQTFIEIGEELGRILPLIEEEARKRRNM